MLQKAPKRLDLQQRKAKRICLKMASATSVKCATSEGTTFETKLERTKEAYRELAEHWKESKISNVCSKILEDSTSFGEKGYKWSEEVGFSYLLPDEALGSQKPAPTPILRDSLCRPTSGGPHVATHQGLLIAPTPPCGYGVFATCDLKKGESLGEYTGEARAYDIWCDEIKDRKIKLRRSDASSPFIVEELYAAWAGSSLGSVGVVVDAYAFGNAMRFINCSCNPSCTMKMFGSSMGSHSRLQVTTLRDIAAWEQLSIDYGWYHDPLTLVEIRDQAHKAYMEDLPHLKVLHESLERNDVISEEYQAKTEAVAMIAEALIEDSSKTATLRGKEVSYLRRFIDIEAVKRFLRYQNSLLEAASYLEIPDPVWHLYEVVGAQRVGVACRCGSDRSLNATGRCSGIIGRPFQASHYGRGEEPDCDE